MNQKEFQPPEFNNPIKLNLDSPLAGKVQARLSRRDFLNMVLIGTLAVAVNQSEALGIRLPPPEGTSTTPTETATATQTESGNGQQTYDSVKDAFAAIQPKCFVYPDMSVGLDGWVDTVFDFLADHPEIHYVPRTGGWGGASPRYDNRGYCLILTLPLDGDSTKNGGVLIFEAMDTKVDYVRFKGDHYQSIYPPPEGNQ